MMRAVWLALALFACSPREPSTLPSRVLADAGARTTADAGGAIAARHDGELWARARARDPLDLARLADVEGEGSLVAAALEGGDDAPVALAALPFADDAELALRSLGEEARRAPNEGLLRAILGVAGKPRAQREPLDPDGARACFDALVAIARDAHVEASLRALAVSAARALAVKGIGDAAAVPSDLDG